MEWNKGEELGPCIESPFTSPVFIIAAGHSNLNSPTTGCCLTKLDKNKRSKFMHAGLT